MQKAGQKFNLVAPGKLNLLFDITGNLPDGYHSVETVMQAISLFDELEFEFQQSSEMEIAIEIQTSTGDQGGAEIPTGETNLVTKAIRRYCQYASVLQPLRTRCKILKRIPVAGGMGGGSSNAAAALVAINTSLSNRLDKQQLDKIAGELGADVPFFLNGGTQLGRNRGDQLSPITAPAKIWFVVITSPALSLSTANIYQEYDTFKSDSPSKHVAGNLSGILSALAEHNLAELDDSSGNIFESLIFSKYALLARSREKVESITRKTVHLTGSGPTLFLIVEDESTAKRLAQMIHNDGVGPKSQHHDGKNVLAVSTAHSVDYGVQIINGTNPQKA